MTIQEKAQLFLKHWNNWDNRCQDLVAMMQFMGYTNVIGQIEELANDNKE